MEDGKVDKDKEAEEMMEEEIDEIEEEFVSEDKLKDAIEPEPLEEDKEVEDEAPKMVEFPDDSVQGFFGHKDSCFSVAVNPVDCDIVASGGADDRSFIWNCRTGEQIAECGDHSDSVSSVAWNYDGSLLASGGLDGKVNIWDGKDGKRLQTLEGPSGGINCLSWHPKGNALLAGAEDCSAWLWLAALNKNVAVFFGHTGSVECGVITADGKLCITGSEDKTVKIWKPKDGTCAHTIEGFKFHKAPVVQVAVPKNSDKSLILSGDEEGGLFLSNFEGKLRGSLMGHQDSVEGLFEWLKIVSLICPSFKGIAFSPNLPLAATGSMDQSVRIWDLDTMSSRQTLELDAGISHIYWHDTKELVLACTTNGKIKMWDGRSLEVVKEWQGPTSTINDLSISKDWSFFVTAEDQGPVLVFDMKK